MAASARSERRQRESGRTGSGSLEERLESVATGARSDGDDSSLDGASLGGVAIGADGLKLGGMARLGMAPAGAGGIGLGRDIGGADCASADCTVANASTAPRTTGQNFTVQSSNVAAEHHPWPPVDDATRRRLHGPSVASLATCGRRGNASTSIAPITTNSKTQSIKSGFQLAPRSNRLIDAR